MGFITSLRFALIGLWHILKEEPNARIHLVAAGVVFAAGLALGLSNAELAAIFFAILLVFLAEIFNTAFEKTLDIIDADYRPQIKIIKDMAAGAVLVASIGAIVIGVAIFLPYLQGVLWGI